MTDLNIGYSGGSGGFLLLHLLLLSDQYHIEFQQPKSIAEAIDQQWQITDPTQWKTLETWPDNDRTLISSSQLKKIYFCCGPEQKFEQWSTFPGLKLVLYTDYHSQTCLAYYKRANWYNNAILPARDLKFRELKKLLKNWNNHYNNIKDASWPNCRSFRKISRLPKHIQKEVLDNSYTSEFLNYQYRDPVAEYCGHRVFDAVVPVLNSADVVVRLQDLVNSNGSILCELLNIPTINQRQLELLERWKQLHPPEMLKQIGINHQ